MKTNSKLSRVLSLLLALVMIFSVTPLQSLAAPVDVKNLSLKNGVTVAISKEMTDDQIKKALFEQLVANPEGASYKDYEWEYYVEGKVQQTAILSKSSSWVSLTKGGKWFVKNPGNLIHPQYDYVADAMNKNKDAEYQIRLAGTDKAVKIKKVSTASVNYNWDSFMGTVKVNNKVVSKTVNGLNPAREVTLNAIPNDGYKIQSVKMNGTELQGVNGVYKFYPVASTKIDVVFAEDGVFNNINLTVGNGAAVKVNGVEVKNTIRVKQGANYKFEVTPNSTTSVKAVLINGKDITSEVNFKNYVGTFTKQFTADDTIQFVTVNVNDTIVLNSKKEAGFAVNADGSPDLNAVRKNFIKGFIDDTKSALVLTTANTLFELGECERMASGIMGTTYNWVPLEGKPHIGGSVYEPVKPGTGLDIRVKFLGNEQFRPTDFVEFKATVKDVQKANFALKSNPVVEIKETAVGVYDYANLNEKVFAAAIDAAASFPANITLKDIVLTVPQNITKTGSYKVKASIAGTTSYYAASVEFNVQFNIVKRPTADIVLTADTVNVELNETKVGVYDNAKMKESAKAAAINRASCEANGLDYDKITIEMADAKADGTYTAKLSYPTTDMIYGASKDVKVVVKVNKAPKAQFTAKDNQTATLFMNFDGSYDYAELKSQIFNLITVTGVPEGTIKAEDCEFKYFLKSEGAVFIGQDEFYDFTVTSVPEDLTGGGRYLYEGGRFTIKVTLPSSETYYGTAIDFKVNVVIKDNHTAQVVLNEGAPYKVVLNKNKNGTFDYNGLKADIFAKAVKEIKNVTGTIRYTDVNFQYKPWNAKEFHNFEEEVINGDYTGLYTRLCDSKKQDFDVTLNVPGGLDYHGTTVEFKINVEVKDPHKASIAINKPIAPVTLTETTVGVYDYETLKKDIYAAAVNAAASTPSTVKYEDFTIVAPQITKSGDYTVTLKYLGDSQYNGYDISTAVHVDVNKLPTAVIELKLETVNVVLEETTIGVYDSAKLKADAIAAAVDIEKCKQNGLDTSLLTYDLETVTKEGTYVMTVSYPSKGAFYGSSKKVNVVVTVDKLPTANIALKATAVDAVLKETAVGVYDNAALKKTVYEAAVDENACKENGLDVNKIVFEMPEIKAAGKYTATVKYPQSDKMYGSEKTITVNVTVNKCPTVSIKAPQKMNVTLEQNYDRKTYDYEELKDEIFALLTVSGVENLKRTDFKFEYKILDAMGSATGAGAGKFYEFNKGWLPADAGGSYKYLYKGGSFEIKVSIANSKSYYGTSLTFTANVSISDKFTPNIVLNSGAPYNVVLNKTKAGGYNYDELKETIFNAAVKEVKNVNQKLNWNDFNYQYKILNSIGTDDGVTSGKFYSFEQGNLDVDAQGIYKYLKKGGEFTIKLLLPESKGEYYAAETTFKVNVKIEDPFASKLVFNAVIPELTLQETSVGVYDVEALKKDIFNLAVDAKNSVPSTVNYQDVEIVVPEITKDGKYIVTVRYKENGSYNASSASAEITVKVNKLGTANIALKATTVDAVLKETSVGVYDNAALKEFVINAAVDKAQCEKNGLDINKLSYKLENITTDGQYTLTVSYPTTDKLYAAEKTVTVNVTVDKCPSVKVTYSAPVNATLYQNFDKSYDYEALKDEIFEQLTVTGVENLKRTDFKFEYKLLNSTGTDDGILSGHFYPFEQGNIGADTGGTYHYLRKGGKFTIRVSVENSTEYYGTQVEFEVNVTIKNKFDTTIVLNDGAPYNVVLNKTKAGGYNYDELKETIFNAAVKEVKNGNGTYKLNWNDFNYQYAVGLTNAWHNFETGYVDGDLDSMYHYLSEGGEFDIKVILPASEGKYYAAETTFKVNVKIEDPFASKLVLKEKIDPVVLEEVMVGEYNRAALERAIINAALDTEKCIPTEIVYDELTVVGIDTITQSGDYVVTIRYNENRRYNASSVTTTIRVNVNKLGSANVAIKDYKVDVVLEETTIGVYNSEKARADAIAMAVDLDKCKANGLDVNLLKYDLPTIDKAGTYTLTVTYPDTQMLYGKTEQVTVNVTIKKLPTADIALKADTVNAVLKETSVGSYDNKALKKAVYEAAVDENACRLNGLDTSKLVFEMQEIKEEGTYTATIKYPQSDKMYGAQKTVTVKVTVDRCPMVNIKAPKDMNVTLKQSYDKNSYDYEALKDEIFEQLTVTGVENLKRTDFKFEYKLLNGMGIDDGILSGHFYPFEQGNIEADSEGTYRYLRKGGKFTIKVSIENSTSYYGTIAQFDVNVTVKNDFSAAIVLNDGQPYNVVLNRTKTGGYNYDELKQTIFNAAVKEVKLSNEVLNLNWNDFNYQYKILNSIGTDDGVTSGKFYSFEQGNLDVDAEGIYKYLRKGGEFTIKLLLPASEGKYYASEVTFKVNVKVEDPFASKIVFIEKNPEIILDETRVGVFDVEKLKKDIFDLAIDKKKSVPSTMKYEDVEIIVPEIAADGAYKVTVKYKNNDNFNPSENSKYILIKVNKLPTVNIAVKDYSVNVFLEETTIGKYNSEKARADAIAMAIDLEQCKANGLDVNLLKFDIKPIENAGLYDLIVTYPDTEYIHGASVLIKVNVIVKSLPKVNIVLNSNHIEAVLNETEIGIYDVEALKREVFEKAVNVNESSPKFGFDDVTITFDKTVDASGTYKATIEHKGNDKLYGSKAVVEVKVTVNYLPTVKIETQLREVTLNQNLDGSWDYDSLKKEIFEKCMRVTGVDGLTYDKFNFEYYVGEKVIAPTDSCPFETEYYKGDTEILDTYVYLRDGGDFKIKVSIPDSSSYHGSTVTFKVSVKTADPYKVNIELKPGYNDNFTLRYNRAGEFDYDRLKKEIFDEVIDLSKSDKIVSFENAVITYQLLNFTGLDDSILSGKYYDFNQGHLDEDLEGTYHYLYKGGRFNIKIAFGDTQTTRYTEIIVNVNVDVAKRVNSNVILNDVQIDYTKDVSVIKKAIYDSIDFGASKLPSDVSIEDFEFEYYTLNYTAGDLPGVEYKWVPLEGMKHPTLLDSYYKQIPSGNFKIRVRFKGASEYLAVESNIANINISASDVKVSVKQNYIYRNENIPSDFVVTDVQDNFTKFEIFAYMGNKTETTIFIDTAEGLNKELAFAGNVAFNDVLLKVFGIETILSADEVYYRRGLSRAELETLVAHPAFVEYMKYYHNVDADGCAAIAAEVESLTKSINHVWFKIGQPSKPGTYRYFVMASAEFYNTATASGDFFIKFRTKYRKLNWMQDINRKISAIEAKDFDFTAVFTRDGKVEDSSHVKYIYTGFTASGRFYGSTTKPPREVGIYTQTAWTGIKGPYAFPKTRTFRITLF